MHQHKLNKPRQRQNNSLRRASPSAVKAEAGGSSKKDKTVLVTGANTGIGLVAAKDLAGQGYDVVLGCRDASKAKAALAAVRGAAAPGVSVSLPNNDSALLDLSSLESVRDFSAAVLDAGKPLHVLLNNAGVMALPRRETTKDGFEYQLGVNHVGHAALTWRLLPLLLETAADAKDAAAVRVVTVASSAHQFGKIDFADLNCEESYSAWGAYGQSKLANILFAYELARRTATAPGSTRFTSNALHPGVVKTELARYLFGKKNFSFFSCIFSPTPFRQKENLFSLTVFLSFPRRFSLSLYRPGHRRALEQARGPPHQPLFENAGAGSPDEHLPLQQPRHRGRLRQILCRLFASGLQPRFVRP